MFGLRAKTTFCLRRGQARTIRARPESPYRCELAGSHPSLEKSEGWGTQICGWGSKANGEGGCPAEEKKAARFSSCRHPSHGVVLKLLQSCGYYCKSLVTSCCTLLAWAKAAMPVWLRISYLDMLAVADRSEEHTSELRSRQYLVC